MIRRPKIGLSKNPNQRELDFDRPLTLSEIMELADKIEDVGAEMLHMQDTCLTGYCHWHRVARPFTLDNPLEPITETSHVGAFRSYIVLNKELLEIYMEDNRLGGQARIDWAFRPGLWLYFCEPCKTIFYLTREANPATIGRSQVFPLHYNPLPNVEAGLRQLPAYRRLLGIDWSDARWGQGINMQFVREYDYGQMTRTRMDALYGFGQSLPSDADYASIEARVTASLVTGQAIAPRQPSYAERPDLYRYDIVNNCMVYMPSYNEDHPGL
jgi:hypothetical protein